MKKIVDRVIREKLLLFLVTEKIGPTPIVKGLQVIDRCARDVVRKRDKKAIFVIVMTTKQQPGLENRLAQFINSRLRDFEIFRAIRYYVEVVPG
jgi:hypothetical protein